MKAWQQLSQLNNLSLSIGIIKIQFSLACQLKVKWSSANSCKVIVLWGGGGGGCPVNLLGVGSC